MKVKVAGDTGVPANVTVAVAVKSEEGSGSQRAVKWAVEKLLPKANRFVLVHVMPTITTIPTPLYCEKHVETLVLEGNNPATVLLKYVNDSGIKSLVLGSFSPSYFARYVGQDDFGFWFISIHS
ncbi:hypothetical protein R3W88_032608 [Solanum pinnatisectum]|uniref:UspA domain-containing protein n=1 Tax=Solanum pinnatisectum TaxID=50273 RepID=A0AAV9LPN1_9SOLN|nr:hypothetical protein R3W88_032608 [Solanum pinnatisectum]